MLWVHARWGRPSGTCNPRTSRPFYVSCAGCALCLALQGDDDRDAHRAGRHADAQRGERDGARANHHNDHAEGGGGGGGAKRPASALGAEDQDGRKRVRRLLGRALLGTLQKFRQEDAQFNVSNFAYGLISAQSWGVLVLRPSAGIVRGPAPTLSVYALCN